MKLNLATPLLAAALLATAAAAVAQGYGPPQGPPPGQPYGQPGWNTPPGEYREYQQLGFRDGIEGARKDFENHRPLHAGKS